MTNNEEHIIKVNPTNITRKLQPIIITEKKYSAIDQTDEQPGFLLWQDGGKIILEDDSGFILLENS